MHPKPPVPRHTSETCMVFSLKHTYSGERRNCASYHIKDGNTVMYRQKSMFLSYSTSKAHSSGEIWGRANTKGRSSVLFDLNVLQAARDAYQSLSH